MNVGLLLAGLYLVWLLLLGICLLWLFRSVFSGDDPPDR